MKKSLIFFFIMLSSIALSQHEKATFYIVKKGDTLWDISARFLHNPWLWPKIWEQNKYIENPHLIFPGDPISLPPQVIPPEVVAQVPPSPLTPAAPPPEEGEEEVLPPEEKEVVEVPSPEAPPQAPKVIPLTAEIMKVTVPLGKEGEVFYYPIKPYVSYLSTKKPEPSGRVVDSPESFKSVFGEEDEVYITFNKPASPGSFYYVVRIDEELDHPVTGKFVGYKIRRLGVVRAVSEEGDVWRGKIIKSFDAIERGDMLVPYLDGGKEIQISKTERTLEGYIISSPEWRSVFGEGDIVYIDLGSEHGVKEGNLFIVYRPGDKIYDPLLKRKVKTPAETVGKLVVVEVNSKFSVAVITKSKSEIHIPEKIVSDFY